MKNILEKIKKVILIPELRTLPGCLAFGLTISIIPILTLVFMVINMTGFSFTTIIENLSDFIPKQIFDMLLLYVPTTSISFTNILVILASFIVASRGTETLIICSNILYKLDEKEYIKRKLKSFVITLLLILLIIVTLFILAFGNFIVQLILGNALTSTIGLFIYKLFIFIKWPFSILFIYVIITAIYNLVPNKKIKYQFFNKGALVCTICWSLLTLLYMTYINNFTSYNIIYGSLSTIMVLIMWLYFLSYILIIGIQINALPFEKNNKK